MTEGAKEMYI